MTEPTDKQRHEIRGAMAGCVVRTEHVVCGVDNLPDGRYVAVVQFTVTPEELRTPSKGNE